VKNDEGTEWVKQTEESDNVRVYTPFSKDDPLMISTLEKNPNSGITYGNPNAEASTNVSDVSDVSSEDNEVVGVNTSEDNTNVTTTSASVNYKETPEYFRNNKSINSDAVNKYSLRSDGFILKDGGMITAEGKTGGIIPIKYQITGVRVEGTKIMADATAVGRKQSQSLGEFVKQGDGYKWVGTDNFDKLEGDERKEMEAFISAVEHDNKFSAELFAASSSGSSYDVSSYNRGGYVTRPVKHPYLSLKIVGKI
jgi:hypothetical protein